MQTLAPNESLLRRLRLQTNLYCADSGSKRISTAQTWAPNDVLFSRWQRPYWDPLPSLFYSGRKQRGVVHLFLTVYGIHIRQPFDWFLHNWNEGVFPLFRESYSMECKGNLEWVRLKFPAPTYLTPLGSPTPHNTIKTIRRAHQDTKKTKKNRSGNGQVVTWLSVSCQASLITSLLLELYRKPYLCCTRCTPWHEGWIYCCFGHVEQLAVSVALFLSLWDL